mmetsp:Transcript_77817/g.207906  ORF Transcript_77817/g.207906 Transcript_77817/m.207906 type:complete len:208 (+) Transcript_77817:1249-1872(+)
MAASKDTHAATTLAPAAPRRGRPLPSRHLSSTSSTRRRNRGSPPQASCTSAHWTNPTQRRMTAAANSAAPASSPLSFRMLGSRGRIPLPSLAMARQRSSPLLAMVVKPLQQDAALFRQRIFWSLLRPGRITWNFMGADDCWRAPGASITSSPTSNCKPAISTACITPQVCLDAFSVFANSPTAPFNCRRCCLVFTSPFTTATPSRRQ